MALHSSLRDIIQLHNLTHAPSFRHPFPVLSEKVVEIHKLEQELLSHDHRLALQNTALSQELARVVAGLGRATAKREATSKQLEQLEQDFQSAGKSSRSQD
jgi:hypothetical protein